MVPVAMAWSRPWEIISKEMLGSSIIFSNVSLLAPEKLLLLS